MDEKQLEQYNPDNKPTPIERDISPEDREFIKYYAALGDAGKAVAAAFPHKHYAVASLKVIGARKVKEFGLKDKSVDHLNERFTGRRDDRKDELVQHLKKQYSDGVIDVNKMFAEMTYLAYNYEDAKVRLDALKTLHNWYDKVKSEVQANKLEGVDVVDLMDQALAALPKEKYLKVLKLARQRRLELIKRRAEVINVEKIYQEERQIIVKEKEVITQDE